MSLLQTFTWSQLSKSEQVSVLSRPRVVRDENIKATVAEILTAVKSTGDKALLSYTQRFDCSELNSFLVAESEMAQATERVAPDILSSLKEAIRRIQAFHEAQRPQSLTVETSPGVICEKRYVPIERVGLYVPGGTAPLPSTLMMLAIPALTAGCSEIFLTTPPNRDGKINDVILAAAQLLGINKIFKCGGAQAIAALAYGTETIPKVDKIYGPGNAWVTEAKMQVAFDPLGAAIDLPAGPSEVLVIADSSAAAPFVAADLLSQAEHDVASQVILVSTSEQLIADVKNEIEIQLPKLSRCDVAFKALQSSRSLLAADIAEAMEISNRYAPEHLILQVREPRQVAEKVRHAGSVFIGPWTPESVGDYASGTNHVLPTYGFARAFSGLGLMDFMKSISFQELSTKGLKDLGPVVECLAQAEGLQAHAQAVALRLQALKGKS